jgi:hypothetical protein
MINEKNTYEEMVSWVVSFGAADVKYLVRAFLLTEPHAYDKRKERL